MFQRFVNNGYYAALVFGVVGVFFPHVLAVAIGFIGYQMYQRYLETKYISKPLAAIEAVLAVQTARLEQVRDELLKDNADIRERVSRVSTAVSFGKGLGK